MGSRMDIFLKINQMSGLSKRDSWISDLNRSEKNNEVANPLESRLNGGQRVYNQWARNQTGHNGGRGMVAFPREGSEHCGSPKGKLKQWFGCGAASGENCSSKSRGRLLLN